MGSRKTIVYSMTALLLAVLALVQCWQFRQQTPVSIVIETEEGSETIRLWESKDGVWHGFLPGYARTAGAVLKTAPGVCAWVEGTPVGAGLACDSFPESTPLRLSWTGWGGGGEKTLVISRSDRVATAYIDVVSGSMDYIHQKKGNEEPGSLRLYTPEGTLDCAAQIKAMNGRGNSTWDMEKKPYSVELATSEDLLGMGAAKKWILLANWFDASNIGNKMAYEFAGAVGAAYSPECQWVDLYLNGEYRGLYLLCERNEVHPQRVAISENGSFLISTELEWRSDGRDYDAFLSNQGYFMRVHHGGMPVQTIQGIWHSAENAIYSDDGIDAETGMSWQELIDVDSWAQQLLLCEVFTDFDACWLSQFFYYDSADGKIYAGPVWDMDNILNRGGWFAPNILAAQRRHVDYLTQESIYYHLLQKEAFHQRVVQLYREVYRPLLLELENGGMERYLHQCLPAAQLDILRWDKLDPVSETERMRDFLRQHREFLDAYWSHEEDYFHVEAKTGLSWRTFAVRRGETAEFLTYLEAVYGDIWFSEHGGEEPYDLSRVLEQDLILDSHFPED